MTERQIGVYMTFNLLKQGYEWGTSLTEMNRHDMKKRFNITMAACKNLIELMERDLEKDDPQNIERFWEDSECFSKILEIIRKADTTKKKEELLIILREYSSGNLTITETV